MRALLALLALVLLARGQTASSESRANDPANGTTTNPAQDRDIADEFRQALLKDLYFQGTDDRYRQLLDENTAVQAVAALVAY